MSDTTKGSAARVNEIDLLRFVAALAVMLFHYLFRGAAADNLSVVQFPSLAPWAAYGYLGVELFFLISGFVILMTVREASAGSFIASRVSRLYPAFWVCCTLTFVVTLLIGAPRFSASGLQYAINLSMLNGFVNVASIDGVYWSLFVELKFYALVALLLLTRQLRYIERYLWGWLALVVVASFVSVGKLNYFLLDGYAPLFAGGALCYLIFSQGVSGTRLVALALAWLLAITHVLQGLSGLTKHFQFLFDAAVVVTVVSVFFAVMLAVALRRLSWLARRRWTLLGALTYPLYLLHQNIGYMLFNLGAMRVPDWLLLMVIIILMLLLAYLVHRYVERPVGLWLRQLLEAKLFPRLPRPIKWILARQ